MQGSAGAKSRRSGCKGLLHAISEIAVYGAIKFQQDGKGKISFFVDLWAEDQLD